MRRAKGGRRAAKKTPGRLSLRALAKQLGVSEGAIRKAVRAGRLPSVAHDAHGRPYVTDLELAAGEWLTNRAKPGPGNGNGTHTLPGSLTDAQIRVNFQREIKLELENLQKRGVLIDAARERRADIERAKTVRDSMLNLPDRLSAELAAESDAGNVHARLDEEIRKALVALADLFARGDDDDGE